MAEYKSEIRSPTSTPCPSNAIDCRVTQDTNKPEYCPKPEVQAKPELTFSIERILGLDSHGCSQTTQPKIKEENIYFTYNNPPTALFGDDYDEDDIDDEDDDEDECIDVDVDDAMSSNVSGQNEIFVSDYSKFNLRDEPPSYQWLQCTRYHPPKIQRNKKIVTKKRKLGRNPRVPFTQHQVSVLEETFRRTHYLSSMDVVGLSTALNLTETRVKIWFQNRRARERRDKEASQRKQTTVVNKATNFQPLTIPSVAWPITAPMTTGNYPRFDGALNFRPDYLSSAFRLYSSTVGADPAETRSVQSCQNRHPPSSESGIRQLVAYKKNTNLKKRSPLSSVLGCTF